MGETSPPSICIAVPTCRRPDGLRRLLDHIARLNYSGAISVVVVENDAEARAGAAVVEQVSATYPFRLTCLVESRRGHSFASNCGFNAACRMTPAPDYVGMLDDDEYPDIDWLREMVDVAVACDAEIVGGPVLPVFETPNHWLAKSDIYRPTRFATGPVAMIYGSGSMLIKRSTLEQYLDEPFLNEYALTGGGDEEFFWRCRRDGRTFAWADQAKVFEATPKWRTTVGYLVRRVFRKGSCATRVERKFMGDRGAAALRWCKGLGLIGTGALSLPITAFGGRVAMMRSLLLAVRGTGRIAGEFGILYEEYRDPR